MLIAEVVTKTYFYDLSGYPRWMVVLVGTLVLVVVIWIGVKVLKVALWMFLVLVLLGGLAWAAWEFFGKTL